MIWLKRIVILQLLFIQSSVADEALGRLFFTAEQRQTLNRLRIEHQQPKTTAKVAKQNKARFVDKGKLQGYVKRNDGKQDTVWINGEASQQSSERYEFE